MVTSSVFVMCGGKTSLIKQLVGEELRFEPELKCEAQIEAIQTRIETTWLSELSDHEDKLEQALTLKRLASLLASQIELQQLLLKQQQQGSKPASTLKQDQSLSSSSSSSKQQQDEQKKYPSNSSTSQQSNPKALARTPGNSEGEKKGGLIAEPSKRVCQQQEQQSTQTHDIPLATASGSKQNTCKSPSRETDVAPSQQYEPYLSDAPMTLGATLAPNSLSLSSHQAQLTYQDHTERQQLERPTILISSSSLASSSTNLCEQNESPAIQQSTVCEKLEEIQAQAGSQMSQTTEESRSKEKELIENTCGSTYNSAKNQQFNDHGSDRNQRHCFEEDLQNDKQSSNGNKRSAPTINQPLDHNRDDSWTCVRAQEEERQQQQQQQQQQQPGTVDGEIIVAKETSTENANHVPDGKGQQKQHSKSDKGNVKEKETSDVEVLAGQHADLSSKEPALIAVVALSSPRSNASSPPHEHANNKIGPKTSSTHDQLKQIRSLDVSGRKSTAMTSVLAGSYKDNNEEKDDAALGGNARDSVGVQPYHQHHQHRHSYCAPTSVGQASTTTTSGASGRFAATKDELSTQAKIINILFSNNKTFSSSSSSSNNQDPKHSNGQETSMNSGCSKPLLMPSLLRQYQRRLSNFHSHSSSHNHHHHQHHQQQQQQQQQQQHQSYQDSSPGLKQTPHNGAIVIDRKTSMAQAMSELIVAEQKRRAQLVREAACAAASLATSAAAAAQALLVSRSPIINPNQLKMSSTDQRRKSQLQDSLGNNVAQEHDERTIAHSQTVALPIFGGSQPSSWTRGSDPLDEHRICQEANLYALAEELRHKLATYDNRAQGASNDEQTGQKTVCDQKNNESSDQCRNRSPLNLDASLKGHKSFCRAPSNAHKYDIKHFCANYVDNMNLYEIKIVDMPTIEPVSEFPTSSLLEWSLFKGRSHLLTADAYLLVFDLTRPSTIQYIKTLRDKIFESREMSNVPVYVIANKADLCPTLQPSLQARQMRNVHVHRHQASLNSGNNTSAVCGLDADVNGQSSRADQHQQGSKKKTPTQDQRTKSKWSLRRRSYTKSPAAATPMPPPPTTFNLSSEQRSVPAAAAHQLLAAYKMHRMKLGGTGPIVSLRRWAQLRRAVALHEPQYYGSGFSSSYSGGTSYLNSSNSAWGQSERKRTHYSLIIGASGGVDSRAAYAALNRSGRLDSALGRVRSCIQSSWSILTRRERRTSNSGQEAGQALRSRGKLKRRSRFATAKAQRPSGRRRRGKSRATRTRDHTESALIKGAKRRKSSIFVGPFNWSQATDESSDEHDNGRRAKTKKSAKRAAASNARKHTKASRSKNVSAATRRSNWSNWLHFSAPSDMTKNTRQGQATIAADRSMVSDRSSGNKMSELVAATWRASGQRLGLKRKRTSNSTASVESVGSNSRGILKSTKQQDQKPHTLSKNQSLDIDRLDVNRRIHLESASTVNQRDSNTDTQDGDVALYQPGVTISLEGTPKRRLVEPVCGAMSTPASRQTFYDLFNRLLQTSSTTAAKTQLKRLGAADDQKRGTTNDDVGSKSEGGGHQAKGTRPEAGGGNLLKITQEEQQSSNKKSKRRKSSSTGAALWQTISSLALSRISQSGDRKNSGNALEKVASSSNGDVSQQQRSASALGGRLSVTSRASGCSISGLTIFEDPQQQREADEKESKDRREAQSNLLASDGLKLGTDQYLSVDMLRKLSLISSNSQISATGEAVCNDDADDGVRIEDQKNGEAMKRPKSAPNEPVGVAQALRRASRVWLGNKADRHKRQQDVEDNIAKDENSQRPHTSEPGASASAGAKRFWYRGVVKKILFHSNKQSIKGIVTAMELQRKADEEMRANNETEQANEEAGGEKQQSSSDATRHLIIDVVQPIPSTSTTVEEEEEEEDADEARMKLASIQQPRRQSLAVVQSAPSIRIIGSGSSLSLLSENNVSGSSDPSKQSATPTKLAESAQEAGEPELKPSRPKETVDDNSKLHQEPSEVPSSIRTISASSSAGSLASNSVSLSESVSLDIDTSTNAVVKKQDSPDMDEKLAGTDSADLVPDDGQNNDGTMKKSDSSSSSSSEDSDEDESNLLDGLGQPQVNYQLRKLSADDCLIINRHRRQSMAALQDGKALSVLKNIAKDKNDSSERKNVSDETSDPEGKAQQQTADDNPCERASTGEEGRRQSIKQSIEAAIHLLVPRAKARSASITLGATDCERRSRSQLGTAIMGAVNVHKTWRDWRQLLGRKKSANNNKDGVQGGDDSDKVKSNGVVPDSRPNFMAPFSGSLLGDSLYTTGSAAPPIVGFLSSHVAYKKLSVDQQREAAINLDQLMRINQLTLTAASVVMLAASQPPVRSFPTGAHASGSHATSGTRRHDHNHSTRHHHRHKSGQSDLPKGISVGNAATNMSDSISPDARNDLKSIVTSLEASNHESKRKILNNSKSKNQPQGISSGDNAAFQPLITHFQSGGNALLRKSSLNKDRANRGKKRSAKAHDDNKNHSSGNGTSRSDELFGPLAMIGTDMNASQAANFVRAQSALGDESSSTAAAAAAAAAAASSQAPPADGDISAQIAAAAASALERQRKRGEKLSSILEPRYDKKQPGAEYPIFVSHDLNPILKDLAQLVRKHWKCNYIECSAASNWNVRPIISELTRALECNNRLSSSSSGISVGDDSEKGINRMQNDSSRSDHFFDNDSDDVWSSGEDDYILDDEDDSALTSPDESSFNFISHDESNDEEEANSGLNADEIQNLGVPGQRERQRRTTNTKKPVPWGRRRRRRSNSQASKCSIM